MKPTEHDITLMERYFDSDLSLDEMATFSARLQHDEIFRSLVEREKIIIGAIRSQGLMDNLHYLKSVEEKIQGNSAHHFTTHLKKWYYYAAAAVVTLLIVVKVLLPAHQSTDALFAEYFKPYPNVFEPTVRGTDMATKRTEAFQAYEKKNYKQAALLFNELLATKKESEILFLLGNTNLMLGQVTEAKGNFVTLINDFDDMDLQAKWYLSLCYLKGGDRENARKILRELGETEISYASKAKELLEKVN
jgi:tetratricopeptide (TPR) repeat protein